MNSQAAPIKEASRLQWVDAARGFAIFGIFMVNIGAFSAPYFLYGGAEDTWTQTIDRYTMEIIDIFFQASFYTLFSLLFGFGFQMLKERLVEKNIDVGPFLFRRLFILICFGVIHAFFIWNGDILLSYGIIGLFLPAFINRSNKTMVIWAVLILGGSTYVYSRFLYAFRDYLDYYDVAAIYLAIEHYSSSNLLVILGQNSKDWFYANGIFSYFMLATTLLPLFLFGMFIARKRWLHQPDKNKSLLVTAWVISLVIFLVLKMGPYAYGNPTWFSYIQDNIGGTASALFYVLSIVLLTQTKTGMKLMKPLTYVGRMSLSNYITQSIICFILFYGVGFGLYGSIRPSVSVVIVVIVFVGQIFVSRWWFSHFLFGPLEWIWRSLTYWQRQPLKKVRKEQLSSE
ncbi:DUF418 domain-containing protein [Virgibacillus dakarensis]|uniref:DUF418 domain-containing protein n=1 Tax=Lentibacillus populi TaxID=1827502 RepID=A0A9W5TXR9_9BACI|nr:MULTISPECIES: DUF418 domain-containing protein [Bacillaceae]MTW85460.1 DUF418 domain-containing protein [Virgibacillus dakarensis]GGB39638.1 hypothetical protein GCM10011409_16440 [Lentibacillus populi]